jgi:hypothetical protein
MAFYGPKKVNESGDSIYYQIPENSLNIGEYYLKKTSDTTTETINKTDRLKNSFLIIFSDNKQEDKIAGILELEKYKKEKLDIIDIRIVKLMDSLPTENDSLYYRKKLNQYFGINTKSISLNTINGDHNDFERIRASYFLQKPIHVFNYFAVLVDKNKNIRGYYDPTYISEVKRMIEEYKHLVLKDEQASMKERNKIESK